ncbi:MAG TPA: 50S ribosomal protein L18 [Gammaproteobacteria bacterium]|nr:50S ribosomal protein L18 [Gammaproteobacteria bacterium]
MRHKEQSRERRSRRTRANIRTVEAVRLTVHRTPRHMYAQLISPGGATTLAAASTLDAELRESLKDKGTGNIAAAVAVGKLIAERGKGAGVSRVAFDRSGYKYHGRVRALADAAREAGLEF